ncbi:MAG: hypothetical protein KGL39_40750 [Patescibacteria group bacterium]|nr:hypothetical protein [Patescibacteria group bacterium]
MEDKRTNRAIPDEELGVNVRYITTWQAIVKTHGLDKGKALIRGDRMFFCNECGEITYKAVAQIIGKYQIRHNDIWHWDWGFSIPGLRQAVAPMVAHLCEEKGELHATVVETIIRKYAAPAYDFVYTTKADVPGADIVLVYGVSGLHKFGAEETKVSDTLFGDQPLLTPKSNTDSNVITPASALSSPASSASSSAFSSPTPATPPGFPPVPVQPRRALSAPAVPTANYLLTPLPLSAQEPQERKRPTPIVIPEPRVQPIDQKLFTALVEKLLRETQRATQFMNNLAHNRRRY